MARGISANKSFSARSLMSRCLKIPSVAANVLRRRQGKRLRPRRRNSNSPPFFVSLLFAWWWHFLLYTQDELHHILRSLCMCFFDFDAIPKYGHSTLDYDGTLHWWRPTSSWFARALCSTLDGFSGKSFNAVMRALYGNTMVGDVF